MDPLLEKLTKVLELERRQGFSNAAVIGGLSAFLGHWEAEAADRLPGDLVAQVADELKGYSDLAVEERSARVATVMTKAAEELQPTARHSIPDSSPRNDKQVSDRPGEREAGPKAAREQEHSRQSDSDPAAQVPAPSGDDPDLDRPIVHLRGFGKKAAANLGRLGIETIRDLLLHTPLRYNDFRELKSISELSVGEGVTIVGAVSEVRQRKIKGGRDILTVVVDDTTATVDCTFFNQPYLVKQFPVGRRVVVSGTVERWAGKLVFQAPDWERLDRDLVHTARLVPVYPLTKGVSQRWLRGRMKTVVPQWSRRMGDPVPVHVLERHGMPSIPDAIKMVHFPKDEDELEAARTRLAFDELLFLQLWARLHRRRRRSEPAYDFSEARSEVEEFLSTLPYQLTHAQSAALQEIVDDMCSDAPMLRLLQGDVGSGKTVVAVAAMVLAVASGTQAALMAPTEILAEQHFDSLGRLLCESGCEVFDPAGAESGGDASQQPLVARLVGSMNPKEKQAVVEALASGEISFLVGTHALIQESVRFERLGLAVIDEQHRFGVLQRSTLPARGTGVAADAAADAAAVPSPHVLVMTATPIPRTLSMVLSADLDQSVIDELPPGRRPVQTMLLEPDERERAYQFIRHRVEQGEQAYVVYPLVEDSDAVAARAATAEFERLRDDVFPDISVGLVHGRMPTQEKDAVMTEFHEGKLSVLVATSVIEVGVDVPNATVMLIDGADRFGLAQLHQFRGRVGRGQSESVCLLMSDSPSDTALERLKAIASTTDGLALAEKDLQMRGPGDYFGVRQSGLVNRFRFARLAPSKALTAALEAAEGILRNDPDLERTEHAALRARVADYEAALERA